MKKITLFSIWVLYSICGLYAQADKVEDVAVQVQAGHTIKQFCVTNNERYVFTTDFHDVVMWDLRKRKIISRIPFRVREIYAHPISPRLVCVIPEAQFPSKNDFIPVIDAITGEKVDVIEKGKLGPRQTFTNDMTLKLNDGIVDVYMTENEKYLGSLNAMPAPLSGKIDVNKQGDILVGGLHPIIWKLDDLTAYRPMKYFDYLKQRAVLSGNIVVENDYTKPYPLGSEPSLSGPTTAAHFEPDGSISVCGYDGEISYWNPDGTLLNVVKSDAKGAIYNFERCDEKTIAVTRHGIWIGIGRNDMKPNKYFNDKLGYFDVVYDVTPKFANGKFLVGCDNSKVVMGDYNNDAYYSLFRRTSDGVHAVKISPDEKWALMVGDYLVCEAQIEKEYNDLNYKLAFEGGPCTAAYLPNNIICVGTTSGEVAFWKRGVREQLKLEKVHKSIISDIKLSHDKKHFYTSEEGGTVVVWDAETLSPLVYLHRLGTDDYIYITPDNYYTGSKILYDKVHYTQGSKIYSFEQFDLIYNRPDIIAKRLGLSDDKVKLLYDAWVRRVRRMGFDPQQFSAEMHAPTTKIVNSKSFPQITSSTSVDLKIKAKDTKYRLSRLMISVNGVPVLGRRGAELSSRMANEMILERNVELAEGMNHIEVSCINEKGSESYKDAMDIWCEKKTKKPTLYLGVVGVSDYKEAAYNLGFAAKDAEDFKMMIEKHCASYFEKIKVKLLTNTQATKDNIYDLKNFYANASIDDVAIAFYAGHGVLDQDLNYYFATYNMDFSRPELNGWNYDSFEDMFDEIKPLAKYCFIDACHSGKIIKEEFEMEHSHKVAEGSIVFRGNGNTMTLSANEKNINTIVTSLFTDLTRGNGSTVFSSSGGMEVAIEDKNKANGLFTWAVKQGVANKQADADANGVILISELADYVSRKVSELSAGVQTPSMRVENKYIDIELFQ